MKCICITGAIQSDLKIIENVLQESGMASPKRIQQDSSINMDFLHDQCTAIINDKIVDEESTSISLGRFVEKLASDIFMANVDTSLWGWADNRSTELLDFWRDYDPRLYFVLVCVSPEQMLASSMSCVDDSSTMEEVMVSWHKYHQQLLRFHLRNLQRSTLIHSVDFFNNPTKFVSHISEQWNVNMTLPNNIASFSAYQHDNYLLFLAQQLCINNSDIASLQNELHASGLVLDENNSKVRLHHSADEIISSYRTAQKKISKKVLQYQEKEQALQTTEQVLRAEMAALIQERDEKTNTTLEQQAQIQQLDEQRQHFESEITSLKNEIKRLSHDCLVFSTDKTALENLLAQQSEQYRSLQNEILSLAQMRDEQIYLANDRQVQLESLSQANQQLIAKNTENSELLLLELHQAHQESEQYFSQLQEKEQALQTTEQVLRAEMAALIQERDEKTNTTLEQHAQIQQLIAKNAENSELLLLELHQAHQESEYYFEQLQDKQKAVEADQAQWQRMLQRHPDYCDYETLLISPISQNSTGWQFRNLHTAERTVAVFDFDVNITASYTAFVFYRLSENTPSFVRWSHTLEEQDTFEMAFYHDGSVQKQCVDRLNELATSDLQLFTSLLYLLKDLLKQPTTLSLPTDFSLSALQFGVNQFSLLLNQLAPVVRYDKVVLKREQVNPDYEHLWFKLTNLSFGSHRNANFEFRLSCANVRPHLFGGHPKLEFPEDSASRSFEQWFEESYDDFGSKLELRFALPDAMDISIWEKLSAQDQAFVAEVITLLPAILNELKHAGVKIKRSWEDWLNMAADIAQIYTMRVLPTPIMPSTEASSIDKPTNLVDKIVAELWDDHATKGEAI